MNLGTLQIMKNRCHRSPPFIIGVALIVSTLVGGCELIPEQGISADVRTYAFPSPIVRSSASAGGRATAYVAPPRTAAAYDSTHISYSQAEGEVLHYALSEWVAPPGGMFEPLLVALLEESGRFSAVVSGATAAAADVRVDTELIYVRQTFLADRNVGEIALRIQLTDMQSRTVIAARTFASTKPAATPDARGGVNAINAALLQVLSELKAFLSDS